MGDPRRKHKEYSRPKHLFDRTRIEEESSLVKKFGLKNKREIWKVETAINKIRGQAKTLIIASQEEQEKFFNRLINLGLIKKGANIDDVLALTKEKLLERRLQTIIFKKGLAKSPKGARQLIVHRKINVKGKVIDAPSYIVKFGEESEITIKKKEKKKQVVVIEEKKEVEEKEEKKEEIKKE